MKKRTIDQMGMKIAANWKHYQRIVGSAKELLDTHCDDVDAYNAAWDRIFSAIADAVAAGIRADRRQRGKS